MLHSHLMDLRMEINLLSIFEGCLVFLFLLLKGRMCAKIILYYDARFTLTPKRQMVFFEFRLGFYRISLESNLIIFLDSLSST